MLWQRINRSNPEKCFLVVYNSYGTAALTNGQAVQWDFTTDVDGVGVTKPAASNGTTAAGVAAETIAPGEYGLIQVWGYHSAVLVRSTTSEAPAGAKGIALVMDAAIFAMQTLTTSSSTSATTKFPCGFMLAAQASWTTKAVACFLKCL